jgi:acetolactate synthase-1/2/3 large subunit
MFMNAAELIIDLLENLGVKYIFGIPGGALEDINTALYNSKKIKPIVTKHEQGAAFMADGYARLSGILGVCCTTAGPGATNLVTGIASSYLDSIPVLALTGQVATTVFGKGAIQESGSESINLTGIFDNITKYSGMIFSEKRAQYMTQKAIKRALSRPTGPVHLNLPSDVMKREVILDMPYSPMPESRLIDRAGIEEAAVLLRDAKRPVIIAGWGVVLSKAAEQLKALAELLDIPVTTSPKAKGIFPESHPLSLGVLGFAGSPVSKEYLLEGDVDVVLGVGTSFNEMMTSGWDKRINPTEHLIQIDVDPEKIGRNYFTSHALVGDASKALKTLIGALTNGGKASIKNSKIGTGRRDEVAVIKQRHSNVYARSNNNNGHYSPRNLVLDIQKHFPDDTIYFADIGNSMAWAIHLMKIDNPYSFFVPLGFGSMGYSVAACIGAKLAVADRPVVTICGDGGFLMTGNEVATAVNYNIPVVWIVFNNGMLGMVHHGRKLFKTPVPEGIPSVFANRVDFVKLAEGYGAQGIRIDTPDGLTKELVDQVIASGKPTVIDVIVDEKEVPPIHSRIATVDKFFS